MSFLWFCVAVSRLICPGAVFCLRGGILRIACFLQLGLCFLCFLMCFCGFGFGCMLLSCFAGLGFRALGFRVWACQGESLIIRCPAACDFACLRFNVSVGFGLCLYGLMAWESRLDACWANFPKP